MTNRGKKEKIAKIRKNFLQKFQNKLIFSKISKDIKKIKIQGARNVAKAALKAYYLIPTKKSKRKLLKLRPTEPMMENILDMAEEGRTEKEILKHFEDAQEKINATVYRAIKNNSVIFTHCHSTNVISALIYSKKKGKKFEVYNTETRPLYQGRITSEELSEAGIKVTEFVDSALGIALSKEQGTKKVDLVLLGSDALLDQGIINKVGSEVIARISKDEKIPVYIIADSWKYSNKNIPLEKRKINEVWDKAPKKIKLFNPAFEFVSMKFITRVISEHGNLTYNRFVRLMKSKQKK